MSEEISKSNQIIDLLQQDESIYFAESNDKEVFDSIDESIVQKSGYLNLKSYVRSYFLIYYLNSLFKILKFFTKKNSIYLKMGSVLLFYSKWLSNAAIKN